MGPMMIGEVDLSLGWRKAVAEGRFAITFPASKNDASGRWDEGTLIKVSLGVMKDSGFGFQATNTETGGIFDLGLGERRLGPGFLLRFSEARALRPGGSALRKVGRQPAISPEANDCRFNCQRSEIPSSIHNHILLAQISEPGLHWDWHVYANSFPTEPYGQLLWLPVQIEGQWVTIPHLPQRWDLYLLEDFLVLAGMSQGMAFLWNSYPGGGASVLHFHIHSVVHDSERAIENASAGRLVTQGGRLIESYPPRGLVWEREATAEELYFCDTNLIEAGYPPNILWVKDRTFMFPRDPEQEVTAEFPAGVLAGNELTGVVTSANREVYETLTWPELQTAFRKGTADPETIVEIFSAQSPTNRAPSESSLLRWEPILLPENHKPNKPQC